MRCLVEIIFNVTLLGKSVTHHLQIQKDLVTSMITFFAIAKVIHFNVTYYQ